MKKNLNFDILESLRGLAALYVVIGHSRANLWIGGEHYLKLHPQATLGISDYLILGLNALTRLSTEFVIIFFVLSGFSIAHSLRNNTQATSFYKRRFVRLYPPYISALLWAILIVWLVQLFLPNFMDGSYKSATFDRIEASGQLFSWKIFLQNLVYLPQLDGVLRPFWSLTMEVIFYLLAPFLMRNKKLFYFSSAGLFLISMISLYSQWKLNFVVSNFFYYCIFFAIGTALYEYYDRILEKAQFLLKSGALWLALIIFFIMIGLSLRNYETTNAFMAAILSVILIVYLLSNNIKIKWLIGIGRFSYTLYITHFATIFLYLGLYFMITKSEPPYIYNSLVFIPCVFLCLGVAYVHYLFVEKRSKEILDRLRRKNETNKTVSVSPKLA